MKLDLHTHTYYPDDAKQSPQDLVRTAKKKGLDGIAITDHNSTRSWKKVIAEGKKRDLEIIRGEEIRVLENGKKIGEVLALFINEEIKPGEFLDVSDNIRKQGGILLVAHPFDIFRGYFRKLDKYRKHFDGIEVFNARVLLNRFNGKALEYAQKYKLPGSGGSDCHCTYEVGNGYTIADVDDTNSLMKALKGGKTTAQGKRTNPLIHTISTLAKLGFFGRVKE